MLLLLFFVIFGIIGIIVFHNIPVMLYMFVCYTICETILFIEEMIEEDRN